MSIWKPEKWKPTFVLFPRLSYDGNGIVWGSCHRRILTNRYSDGFDHMRDIEKTIQYKK